MDSSLVVPLLEVDASVALLPDEDDEEEGAGVPVVVVASSPLVLTAPVEPVSVAETSSPQASGRRSESKQSVERCMHEV